MTFLDDPTAQAFVCVRVCNTEIDERHLCRVQVKREREKKK